MISMHWSEKPSGKKYLTTMFTTRHESEREGGFFIK